MNQYPTLQWIIENGQNVLARNLFSVQPDIEFPSLPQFNIEIYSEFEGKEDLVLFNQIPKQGNCPTWTISGLCESPHIEHHYYSQVIIVKISLVVSETEKLFVLQERFDLTKLVTYRIGGTLSGMVFPINTVLLSIGEELFSSSRQNPNTLATEKLPPYLTMTKDNTRHEHMTDLTQMRKFQQDFQETTTLIEEKTEQYQRMWREKKALQAKQTHSQLQMRQLYLQTLKNKLAAARQAREREEAEERFYFQQLQGREEAFLQHENTLKELQQTLITRKEELQEKSETLMKIKFAIEAKQVKLMYELHDIFPIEIRKGSECFIRDIELPNDLIATVKDDDVVASGLGYVVHLLLLCSKYLDVPLRYQLLYMGSRSLVRDPIRDSAKDPASTYPLFKRSIEKERFEKAVAWLKADIEFLLRAKGIEYDNSKHFLTNLQMLFECDSCSKAKI